QKPGPSCPRATRRRPNSWAAVSGPPYVAGTPREPSMAILMASRDRRGRVSPVAEGEGLGARDVAPLNPCTVVLLLPAGGVDRPGPVGEPDLHRGRIGPHPGRAHAGEGVGPDAVRSLHRRAPEAFADTEPALLGRAHRPAPPTPPLPR